MAVNNTLAKSQQRLGLTAYLSKDAVKNQISNVLGGAKGQQFIASIVSAVNNNPQLQECTNGSIVSAALLGASLNLTPSPQLGQFYLVPFKDKNRGTVAEFVLGYHGMLQLAIRSGQYKKINVLPIKAGELVRFDPLEEEIDVNLIEDEEERENAETIGYYASFTYLNGFKKSIYWSRKKMEAHALRYSAGYRAKKGFTFWEKDFDAMACKTMLRQLLSKWGAMDINMQTALDNDYSVDAGNGTREVIEIEQMPEAIPAPAEEPPIPEPEPEKEEKPKASRTRKAEKPEQQPEPLPIDGNDAMAALFGE
jgi:recombination protein RecT